MKTSFFRQTWDPLLFVVSTVRSLSSDHQVLLSLARQLLANCAIGSYSSVSGGLD